MGFSQSLVPAVHHIPLHSGWMLMQVEALLLVTTVLWIVHTDLPREPSIHGFTKFKYLFFSSK